MNDKKEVLIVTKKGMGIRMKLSDFPVQKRGGIGIRAINTKTIFGKDSNRSETDEVVGVVVI